MQTERIMISETAYFDTYLLHNSKEYNCGKKRPIVIVCPGGGYAFTSDREAEVIALKFNSIGLNSAVLWYTTGDKIKNAPANAWVEAARTVNYIRERAEQWLIDEENVIICGFSAGGHVALQLATRWNDPKLAEQIGVPSEQLKVNLAIVGYPLVYQEKAFPIEDMGFGATLISKPLTANERFFGEKRPSKEAISSMNILNHMNEQTPPMFIWHTTEDKLVEVTHSLQLGEALARANIPFELHVFEKGEHGLALADRTTARKSSHLNPHVAKWFELCEGWLQPYID
ncbi:alpha/beta hydrolase [Enterococcus sp. BWR-S5]|nr:alpha/beta hydrolase [Enterococcus sp. BWR-S5]